MYEYKVDIYKLKYAAEAMNAYAKEGWRVIAVSPDRQEGFVDVFFERPPVIEEKTDKEAEALEAAVEMIDAVPDEEIVGIDVSESEPAAEEVPAAESETAAETGMPETAPVEESSEDTVRSAVQA